MKTLAASVLAGWLFCSMAALIAFPSAPSKAGVNSPLQQPPREPALPATFDLRLINGVTPIKKQIGGTCWAFGVTSAIESNLLVSGKWKALGLAGIPRCSEYHLDWWNGFNKHENPDSPGSGLTVHSGGDYRVAAAYITRGDGLVIVPDGVSEADWHKTTPAKFDPNFKRLYVRDIEWFTIGDKLDGIDLIKRQIVKHGAVGTCNKHGSNNLQNIHFQPIESNGNPNHSIAIVGWDDNKIAAVVKPGVPAPPAPGAWLIKNSHGPAVAEQGYHWISYYDKNCGRDPENGAVSFRNIDLMPYTHVYYHDLHGWRDTLPNVSKAFNAFKAAGPHTIRAVSFYTAKHNVQYTAKIFSKFEDGVLAGELVSQNGTVEFCGFHTVNLNVPVRLKANDQFYVYVELSSGGHAIDRTSTVSILLDQKQPLQVAGGKPIVISKAERGESFYHDGRQWLDLYDYQFANPNWGIFDRTANFCMKALAVDGAGRGLGQ